MGVIRACSVKHTFYDDNGHRHSQKNDQNSKKYKLQNKALKRFDDNKSIFNQIKELM
jgi:hypothetical protein